jgi:DNA-binding transcriptional LysR family regulator
MDLKRLNHFIALAEEGRFASAAQRVHLSPAAFSRSIQTLEDSVGMRLFDRTPQGTTLTRAGQVLQRRASELLFESRCLAHEIDLLRAGEGGELALGAGPVAAATLLPEVLAQLRRSTLGLVFKVRFGNVSQLIDRLDLEDIDFCLGDPRLVAELDRYEMTPVARQLAGVYCRPGHPLAASGVADAGALRRHGLAMTAMTPSLRAEVSKAMGFATPGRFPQVIECDDIGLLTTLVAQSDVLGLLPAALFRGGSAALQGLRYEGGALPVVDLHAIWLKGRTLSPAATRAIVLAQQIGTAQRVDSAPLVALA